MNPADAIRLMARHYPGGWDALAVLCGKSGETLRHAFSGKDARYVPSVLDACTISEACIAANSLHAHAFANAVAANCGGFIALPVVDQAGGVESLRGNIARLCKEASDVLMAGTASLADNHVSDNDYRDLSREIHEAQEVLQRVQRDLDAAHKAGKRLQAV